MNEQNNYKYKNIKLNSDGKFNLKEFNKIYNDFRLYENNDDGYGDWMSDSEGLNRKDIDIPQVFSDDFNLDVFNKTFSNIKNETSTDLIHYEEPKALDIQTNMNYSNLGEDKINNFSNDYSNDSLKYTDYKQAHTKTSDSTICKRKNSTVEELELASEKISYQMSMKI